MPADMSGTQSLFGTLRETVPHLAGVETEDWETSKFKPSARPPDNIQNFLLPGVSPFADSVEKKQTGAVGQINLKELTRWYHSKNLEGKKHTLDEWKSTMDFVKTRAVNRRAASTTGRSSASANRVAVADFLKGANGAVKTAFASHLNEVGSYVRRLSDLRKTMEREIRTMMQAIKQLEGAIASRTDWPIKVNEKCMFYRDRRLGIDLVADAVEIELGKEYQMLTTVVTTESSAVLQDSYDAHADMEDILALLMADILRKEESQMVDTRMNALKPAITMDTHLDCVELRPSTALDVETWREVTDALIKRAEDSMTDCDDLRSTMLSVPAKCDLSVRSYSDGCNSALEAKLEQAANAKDEVLMLLKATKEEIAFTTSEVDSLERAIDAQMIPLNYATTRLEKRRTRPTTENTIDTVHEHLIREVAEMDNAVSALQGELNLNMSNLEDLKAMEAMLEEDFGIKKVTFQIESRCTKIRTFLEPSADNYVVVRMLNDDEFFDLMTR